MAIPNWPTPTDDTGESDDGTPVDLAWTEELHDAIEASIVGTDNPNTFAGTIVDEVIEARDGEASLDDRITAGLVGTDNPGVFATDIIDEVVEARGNEASLNERIDGAVDDDGVVVPASSSVAGAVTTGAQELAGIKTFLAHPIFEPGASAGSTAPVSGVLTTDITQRTGSGTAETDAWTYTLPANVLSANGKAIRIKVVGHLLDTASTRTIKLYWNGANIHTLTTTILSCGWELEAIIIRKSATTQIIMVRSTLPVTLGYNTATPASVTVYFMTTWVDSTPADATLTSTVALKTTLQDSVGGTKVVQDAVIVEVLG